MIKKGQCSASQSRRSHPIVEVYQMAQRHSWVQIFFTIEESRPGFEGRRKLEAGFLCGIG